MIDTVNDFGHDFRQEAIDDARWSEQKEITREYIDLFLATELVKFVRQADMTDGAADYIAYYIMKIAKEENVI